MSLRGKLVAAQAPLAVALIAVGVIAAVAAAGLGERSRLILADNYRSVLAAQRMKDAVERIDHRALEMEAGHGDADARDRFATQATVFERELSVQQGNITESGEAVVTARLQAAWNDYRAHLAAFLSSERAGRETLYFETLAAERGRVDASIDEILALNQDAMVAKSDRAADASRTVEQLVALAVVAALLVGLLAAAWLTARALRPLGVVAAAVRRFGEGDLRSRAALEGGDEIGAVAAEFNRMAERLERYRASSLGELLQAQQAAQAAIDGLPDPIVLLDAEGALRGANAAASRLLLIDPDQAGPAAFAAADPAVRATIDRLRAHVVGGKGPYVPRGFEDALRLSGADGERVFMPRATPLYGEAGAVNGAAVALQDATRLFRFDELKSDLVATVAHEFRTPLTSIQMALHLCTEQVAGPLTPKQADLLFAAREDCERLRVMVDDLLNLSRIESGHIDLHRRVCPSDELIAQAVDVHQAAAAQAQVRLRAEVPAGLPEVFADPDRLQLVFANLLGNAIRYTPAGSEIVLRAQVDHAPGTREARTAAVRFEVADTGPGISAAHQAGLFEKFYRVPGSPRGGSGLGLFISRGLVQAHGGRIGVASDEGRGATFWFTIPGEPPAREAPSRR